MPGRFFIAPVSLLIFPNVLTTMGPGLFSLDVPAQGLSSLTD